MKHRFLIALTLFGWIAALAGWAEELPKSTPPEIHLVRPEAGGLATVVPTDDAEPSKLSGDFGCLNGGSDCAAGRHVKAVYSHYTAGEALSALIEGEGQAEIRFYRNYELVQTLAAALPMEVPVHQFASAGDLLTVTVTTEAGSTVRSLRASAPAPLAAVSSTVNFTFYAYVPPGFYPNRSLGGLFRVTNTPRAGAFKPYSKPGCVVTASRTRPCPAYLVVVGDTDRIARGEGVLTKADGKGTATRIGVMISGDIRGAFLNVPLPVVVGGTVVSTKVTDDVVVAFATVNGRTSEKRLPLGSRPASVTQAR